MTTTEEASIGSCREQGLLDQPGPRVTVYWTAHPGTTQEHVGELGVEWKKGQHCCVQYLKTGTVH